MVARCVLALLMVTAIASSADGQEGFTSPEAFERALGGMPVQYAINFDSQRPGTPAASYGMTRISAEGLGSDGSTALELSPVALAQFPAHTNRLYMGESSEEQGQLLAGNSDMIAFRFDHPVNAFGLYLIGNPSPTGEPAIPFWKLRLDTGFEVLSATEPLDTLAEGSDLYFVGVFSKARFQEVRLYSDNDPAALFSFNVDSLLWAADASATTIPGAKMLPTGRDVVISDLRVTRVHAGRFNVETTDRAFGIAVLGTGVIRGQAVNIFGTTAMTSPDDERVIELAEILSASTSTAPPPLAMRSTSAGGASTVGGQVGCFESIGPNNVGLDVVIWGRITEIAPDLSWMMVNDGAGSQGVRVTGQIGAGNREVGQLVRVAGSVSILELGMEHYALLRVAQPADVVELAAAP